MQVSGMFVISKRRIAFYKSGNKYISMAVKDKVVGWFIRNIVMPGMEIIDKPGFIIITLTDKKERIELREVFFPEKVISELESDIIKKYGKRGKSVLYSIGKKFGYRLSLISRYPNTKKNSKKEIDDFLYFFFRYMEATYAKKLEAEYDFNKKIYIMHMDDYIVCSNNGLGLIYTDGGCAGVWAYIVQDSSMEGVQTKCQGRGAKSCEVICAPPEVLSSKKLKFFKETDMSRLDFDPTYTSLNQVNKTSYAKFSLKDMIDSSFFTHSVKGIEHMKSRYTLTESSLLYIIENELKRLNGADKILHKVVFDFFSDLIRKEKIKDVEDYITQYLSALGFGDVSFIKKNNKYSVIIDFYPWTRFTDTCKFVILRAMISGLMSGFEKKNIEFTKVDKNINRGYLSVILYQK